MEKKKSIKLTFFDEEQTEPDSEFRQIEIRVPLGVNVTILAEKTSPKKERFNLRKTVMEKKESAVAWFKSLSVWMVAKRESAIARLNSMPMWGAVKRGSAIVWFRYFPNWLRKIITAKRQGLVAWFKSPPNALFFICILIYLLVRLIGLTDFPGYFTFDEAHATLLASDFLRDGFRNYAGELFPAFFQNIGGNYNFGTTVYIQLVPLLIFGRSDYVIRATSVLMGLLGAICLSLALRNIFHVRRWWAGILVLSSIPVWFLMSRTEYGVPTFVAFYSVMLYCYWMYRLRNPRYIYPAVIFAALAFYAYAPGQALIPLTIFALFILDFPYHFRSRISAFGGAALGAVCVMPYLRFQVDHAGHTAESLNRVGSYWTQNLPLSEKISDFLGRYLFHLSPFYWFTPAYKETPVDSLLYIMKGYGHLGFFLLPFLLWGLWLLLRRLCRPEYRSLLAVLLIAPMGAALVTSPSSITRGLVMVIPATLIASIGLDDLLHDVAGQFNMKKSTLAAALLVVLLSVNTYMLWDVLNNGISWFDENQTGGVQFGASKVFPLVKDMLAATPNAHAVISPQWAMVSDLVARIYLGDQANVSFASIYDYSRTMHLIQDDTIFVITPQEYDFAKSSPKFSDIQVLKTIPYSKSKAGFYLIHFKYSPIADAIMAVEDAERRKPLAGEVVVDGQKAQIVYTRNDGTLLQDAFDGNPGTLYKTAAINPAVFDLTFPQEREFHSVFVIHGSSPIELKLTFFSAAGVELPSYSTQFVENGDQGNTFNLGRTVTASRVIVSIRILDGDKAITVHIWDIVFK